MLGIEPNNQIRYKLKERGVVIEVKIGGGNMKQCPRD